MRTGKDNIINDDTITTTNVDENNIFINNKTNNNNNDDKDNNDDYDDDDGAIARKSRAVYQTHITCNMSCATWYEGTTQLLPFGIVEIAFIFGLFYGFLADK